MWSRIILPRKYRMSFDHRIQARSELASTWNPGWKGGQI